MFYVSNGARLHFHCDKRGSVKLYRETRNLPFYILAGYNLLILVCKTSRARGFPMKKGKES